MINNFIAQIAQEENFNNSSSTFRKTENLNEQDLLSASSLASPWHHQLNGHEFEKSLGDGERQESLECCSPQGCKEFNMTERLNKNRKQIVYAE